MIVSNYTWLWFYKETVKIITSLFENTVFVFLLCIDRSFEIVLFTVSQQITYGSYDRAAWSCCYEIAMIELTIAPLKSTKNHMYYYVWERDRPSMARYVLYLFLGMRERERWDGRKGRNRINERRTQQEPRRNTQQESALLLLSFFPIIIIIIIDIISFTNSHEQN
jgi:hypothetical protein